MNIYLDVQSPAVRKPRNTRASMGFRTTGFSTCGAFTGTSGGGALRGGHPPLRRPSLSPRPVDRRHWKTHGPRGGGQVRRARADDRKRHLVGAVQPAVQSRELQHAARPPAGVPAGPRRLRPGLLRRGGPEFRLPIRIITQKAWHSLFARIMFLKPKTIDAMRSMCRSSPSSPCRTSWLRRSSTAPAPTRFIIINFREKMALIGGSA